jgi:hypothetical protein
VDYETGQEIEEVLILPIYTNYSSVFKIVNEDVDSDDGCAFLSNPFIFKHGKPFIIKLYKSEYISWGLQWAYSGRITTIGRVAVIAAGFKPLWIWNLWRDKLNWKINELLMEGIESDSAESSGGMSYYMQKEPGTYKLKSISADSALGILWSISNLLEKQMLNSEDLDLWDRGSSGNIRMRFKQAELDSIDMFIT